MDWSLTNFTVDKLLDGDAFPAFSAHELQVYDRNGDVIEIGESSLFGGGNFGVFAPFIDWECVLQTTENATLRNNLMDLLMTFNDTDAVAGLGGQDPGSGQNP